jgi:hypothetical protein
MIENIEINYNPVWEGQTEGRRSKKIYAITGPIQRTTYRRLIDKDGIYLNDVDTNQLLAIKEYGVKNEDSE